MQKNSNNANEIESIKAKIKRNGYCAILCVVIAFVLFLVVGPSKLLAYFSSVKSTTNSFTILPPHVLTYSYYEVDGNGTRTLLERTETENHFAGYHVILGQDPSHTIVNSNYVSREFVIDNVVRPVNYDFTMPASDATIEQNYYLACYSVSTTNGIQKFRTLQEAFDNADLTGSTITVLRDVTETTTPVLSTAQENKNVILDLQGKTLTLDNSTITNNGTLTITDSYTTGKITSTGTAITNNGTLTLGINDSTTSTTAPEIIGETNGIVNAQNSTFNFYDGVVKGQTSTVNTQNVTVNTPTGYRIVDSTETIDGDTYNVATLSNLYTVTYDCGTNGGQISIDNAQTTFTEQVAYGNAVDLTKFAYKNGYQIVGWNTDPTAVAGLASLSMPASDITIHAIFESLAPDAVIIDAKINDANGADYVPGTWTNQNVYIELSEADPNADVARYEIYQNGQWTTSGITFANNVGTLTITNDMDDTLRFRAVNSNNIPSAESTISIKKDTVKPTVTYTGSFGEGDTLITVTVTLADQGGSGLATTRPHVYKSTDPNSFSGSGSILNNGESHTFSATNDENTYIFVEYVSDNAGNICDDNANTVVINGTKYYRFGPYDRVKPVVQTQTVDYNTFRWTATDDSTLTAYGVVETSSSTPSEPQTWTQITGNATGTYDINTSSIQYYFVWVKDEYGNKDREYARPIRLTKNIASYTTLELRNTDENGEVINPDYVLPGCDIYVTGTAATGYHDLVITVGGVDYQPGSIVTIGNSETAISTRATINTYNVTYDLAGGQIATGDTLVTNVTYNNKFAVPNPASRPGYTFLGWSSSVADGLGTNAKVGPTSGSYLSLFVDWDGTATTNKGFLNLTDVNEGTVTLTANWAKNYYEVLSASSTHVAYYETLEEALANVQSGQKIKVLANVTDTSTPVLSSGKNVTLDLNGCTVTASNTLTNNGTLTILDNNSETDGKITSSATTGITNNGTLTIGNNDGTVVSSEPEISGSEYGIVNNQGGTFNFYDGVVIGSAGNSISGTVTNVPIGRTVCKYPDNGNEVAILGGEAKFAPGQQVNVAIKSLAAGSTVSDYTTTDTNVTAIAQYSGASMPTNVNAVRVEDTTSEAPIFMWYDNGTIHWWSSDTTPSLNEDASYTFYRLQNLVDIDGVSSFNTINTTNMRAIFAKSGSTQASPADVDALAGWDVDNVTSMRAMFQYWGDLVDVDGLSGWNTESVEYMNNMFRGADSLTNVDGLGNWDTQSLTDMSSIFYECSSLANVEGIESWNTSNVETFEAMFLRCSALTEIDLSHYNTSSAQNMAAMFGECTGVEIIDVSSFQTSNVTNMTQMFNSCSNLRTIYATNSFVTTAVTESDYMFDECSAPLDGGNGTTYNTTNPKDKTYAHLDGGSQYPGYFRVNTNIYKYSEVQSNGTIVNLYPTLQEAFDSATSGNLIKALVSHTDASISAPTVVDGKTLKLDMAGNEVTLTYRIENYGTLDIYSSANGGKLNRNGVVLNNRTGGTLTTNGTSSSGTLAIVNTTTDGSAASTVIQSYGSLALNTNTTVTYENPATSGTANWYTVYVVDGTTTVNGATISNMLGGTSNELGIIIKTNAPNAKAIVNSGTVEATSYAVWNGGSTQNTTTDSAIKIAGGTVRSTGNNAIKNSVENSLVYITGGTVYSTGANTIMSDGNVTMTGGTVYAYSGMGISVYGSSTLAISGGLVSKEINPETNAWVGGACVQINGAANGILSGNAVIQNKAGNGSNVIYNISTGTLTIDGATVQNLGTSYVGTNASSGTIYVKSGTVSTTGQIVLYNAANSGPMIIGESGSTSTSSPAITGQVTGTTNAGPITINGGKISSTTNMTMRSYGNITINGGLIENNTADTGSNWPYTVFIDSDDSVITINGGTITNNTHSAVVVKNGTTGDITINGGTITTTASTAVLNNGGDTIITGGTITATGGNGVTCSTGTVTVGNIAAPVTSVDNNTATEPRITGSAYGVQVGSSGTFSFYDGVIKGASGQSISRNPDNTPINYTVKKTTANSVETAILTNTYRITLNPNGGSYNGLTSNSIVSANYGEEVNIGYPTRTGYTYTGWKTSGDEITDINILKNTTAMTEFASSSLSTNALGGWRIASNTGGSRTIINVTDPPEPGITKGFDIPGAGNAQDVAQDKIYVTSGNQYTMSVWAKGTGKLRLQLAAQSPFTYKSFTLNNVTEWTKYTWTVTAGSSSGEATIANGYVNAYFGNLGASGTDIQICGMKLEEGTGFSDLLWSKVPSTITSPTLIAQWEVNKYKVTLDSQSANTAGTTQAWYYYNTTTQVNGVTAYYYSDEACTTPLSGGYNITKPTKTGYTFGGYYTQTNGGGTQYVNASGSFINSVYQTAGNRILYAKWIPNKYKITLDNQSATTAGTTAVWYYYNTTTQVNGVTAYYYSDEACTTPLSGGYNITKPTKTGYVFGGYYTETNGGGTQYVSASGSFINNAYKTMGNKTLYAKWTEIPTFNTGTNVNLKMKALAGQQSPTTTTANTNITSIQKVSTIPSQYKTSNNLVSISSSAPIYMWFDNGTIKWWCETDTVYLNSDSSWMFAWLEGTTSIDTAKFDTSKVVNMSRLFSDCACSSINVTNFDTSNVTDMSVMFCASANLTSLDLRNFNTSNVTTMEGMFWQCSGLTNLNLTSFNTINVTNMEGMFYYCRSLRYLSLESFNTRNVTDMTWMFSDCSSLENIYVTTSFVTTSVGNGLVMFRGCTSLVGGSGTTYSTQHENYDYARIDDPNNGKPGYFCRVVI